VSRQLVVVRISCRFLPTVAVNWSNDDANAAIPSVCSCSVIACRSRPRAAALPVGRPGLRDDNLSHVIPSFTVSFWHADERLLMCRSALGAPDLEPRATDAL